MRKPHVLIVDDDEDLIILFENHFNRRNANFTYSSVNSGQDAVDYILRQGRFEDAIRYPICSVVLLDINIPGMNGFDVLEQVKSHVEYQDFPLIATFTNSDFLQDRQKAMELGAHKHIHKIANFYNLFPEIDNMLKSAAQIRDVS